MRQGQTAPRTRTGGLRARAWWILRKNKQMTLIELQATICDGNERNPVANLRKWLNKLVTAGVVKVEVMDDGKLTSNGSYNYVIVRNLGPKAPIVRARGDHVFDPNSNTIINKDSEC